MATDRILALGGKVLGQVIEDGAEVRVRADPAGNEFWLLPQ